MDRSALIHTLRETATALALAAKSAKPVDDNELTRLVFDAVKGQYEHRAKALREAADILERLN